MQTKNIVFCGQAATVACDGRCEKAWGINHRPRIHLSDDNPDDYAYLGDDELPLAPTDPGTYEGGDSKPYKEEQKLNKWCIRECERCSIGPAGESDAPIVLKDLRSRFYNIRRKK